MKNPVERACQIQDLATHHLSLATALKFLPFKLLRAFLRFFAFIESTTHLFSIASALFTKNIRCLRPRATEPANTALPPEPPIFFTPGQAYMRCAHE
jgi:hypothetical protein